MMKLVSNQTEFQMEELICLARRENNTKRSYLLVNPLQGKHMSVSPEKAWGLFHQLGLLLRDAYLGQKVVVIGFAETATAIGAVVASCFSEETYYFQTTRETILNGKNLVNFLEEHSHAMEQRLFAFCEGIDHSSALKNAERIIFAEDEVTTGKTILNFMHAMKEGNVVNEKCKFSVASILNSMKDTHIQMFQQQDIDCYHLIRVEGEFDKIEFDLYDGETIDHQNVKNLSLHEKQDSLAVVPGRIDPRIGVRIGDYIKACNDLKRSVFEHCNRNDLEGKKILLLGTEECMFPALFIGNELEKEIPGCIVRNHATTRSPIIPLIGEKYPIYNRMKLNSLYEVGRQTFLYNMEAYDLVIIVTDTLLTAKENKGYEELLEMLYHFGNKKILGIQWVNS